MCGDAWAQFLFDFVNLLYSQFNYLATTSLFIIPHPFKRN